MNRSRASWLLAAVTAGVVGSANAAPCAEFLDVQDDDPFCTSIAWAKNRQVTTGCLDGTRFCPDWLVTRRQMAGFLWRLGFLNSFLKDGNAFGADAFLGTQDSFDLVLLAGNAEALRLQRGGGESPNLYGGHAGNGGTAFFNGQTIGGGGRTGSNCWNPHTLNFTRSCNNITQDHYATIGGGIANTAQGEAGTVGGGSSNAAAGDKSTVSGGFNNVAGVEDAVVAGGENNRASAFAATVGGGTSNSATQSHAVVAGGEGNLASGQRSIVAGGFQNQATAFQGTVSGGAQNQANGVGGSTVGGGFSNVASGQDATIPGGIANWAPGDRSFAAGTRAKALNRGCFVWADSADFDFSCGLDDAFSVRAQGGFYFVTGVNLNTGAISWGCSLQVLSSGWSCASDRNLKEGLEAVDGEEVVRRLVSMPLYYWSPKGIDRQVRHVGPMAQDFIAAFAVGHDDKSISSQDADGVALAAIQGLHAMLRQRDAQLDELRAEVAQLRNVRAELAELKRAVALVMARTAADRALASKP